MTFDEAVEQYTSYLLKLSYLYVKDRQIAEDIVQEVFLKIYAKYGEWINLEHPKAYIVQMTVNRCRDYFKSWHYRKVQINELLAKQEKFQQEEESSLVESILQLPIKYREVIILYYYDEQSISEMAKLLKAPISTIKTRLQKGRALLKGLIEEEEVKHFAKTN